MQLPCDLPVRPACAGLSIAIVSPLTEGLHALTVFASFEVYLAPTKAKSEQVRDKPCAN